MTESLSLPHLLDDRSIQRSHHFFTGSLDGDQNWDFDALQHYTSKPTNYRSIDRLSLFNNTSVLFDLVLSSHLDTVLKFEPPRSPSGLSSQTSPSFLSALRLCPPSTFPLSSPQVYWGYRLDSTRLRLTQSFSTTPPRPILCFPIDLNSTLAPSRASSIAPSSSSSRMVAEIDSRAGRSNG